MNPFLSKKLERLVVVAVWMFVTFKTTLFGFLFCHLQGEVHAFLFAYPTNNHGWFHRAAAAATATTTTTTTTRGTATGHRPRSRQRTPTKLSVTTPATVQLLCWTSQRKRFQRQQQQRLTRKHCESSSQLVARYSSATEHQELSTLTTTEAAATATTLGVTDDDRNSNTTVVVTEDHDYYNVPKLSDKGIYQLENEEQYNNLINKLHTDTLIIIKFFATYCRACKALAPLFLQVKDDPQLRGLPVVWAEFASQRDNFDLFQRLNVLALPTVHFYNGNRGIVENFPCGPAKIPLLKSKLAQFVNARVDPVTLKLKDDATSSSTTMDQQQQQQQPVASVPAYQRAVVVDNELVTEEHVQFLRHGMPFFRDLTDDEFQILLTQKARLLTFHPGDLIIRQGMAPTTFYVIKSGKVEMSIRSKFEDPISTPSDYLGVVVSELGKFDYFGERALTTGEPYSATCRAMVKTRTFAFDVHDIPDSSVLSPKRRATQEMVEQLSRRYALPEDYTSPYSSFHTSPRDDSVLELLVRFQQIRQAAQCFDYIMKTSTPKWGDVGEIARRNLLVSKLRKAQVDEFDQVFQFIDKDQRGRISLLQMRQFMNSGQSQQGQHHQGQQPLRSLLPKQNNNKNQNGGSASDNSSRSSSSSGSNQNNFYAMMVRAAGPPRTRAPGSTDLYVATISITISRDEFVGIMAEAQVYNLFKETFTALDEDNTGYVRAGDLDEILGGVRDLIGHFHNDDNHHHTDNGHPHQRDRRNRNTNALISADDKDMLVDYEQFSKMLLGATL